MKKGSKLFGVIICLIILCASTSNHINDLQKAGWLIGTWENKTPKGTIYETWSKTNENEFAGKSYIINGKDTIVFENIRMAQEEDGLFYIPIVKNQNDGLPIRFASKIISEKQLIFENKQHDFPQIISYTKISADSLVAEISGIKKGEERKQTFAMKRMK